MIQLEIPGDPVPWAAPQKKGDFMYDIRSSEKEDVCWLIKSQWRGREPLLGPRHLMLVFNLSMPTSWSNKKKQAMEGKPHETKPDLGNLEKLLSDCLQKCGVVKNDSQFAQMSLKKIYSFTPRSIIRILPYGEICH